MRNVKQKALKSFEILKNKKIPTEWAANTRILNGLDYEQDKVIPVHDIFAENTLENSKKIIDLFIIFNKKLVNLGLIDKSFNISKNFGINLKGEMVLVDIGELIENKEEILEQRKKRI